MCQAWKNVKAGFLIFTFRLEKQQLLFTFQCRSQFCNETRPPVQSTEALSCFCARNVIFTLILAYPDAFQQELKLNSVVNVIKGVQPFIWRNMRTFATFHMKSHFFAPSLTSFDPFFSSFSSTTTREKSMKTFTAWSTNLQSKRSSLVQISNTIDQI